MAKADGKKRKMYWSDIDVVEIGAAASVSSASTGDTPVITPASSDDAVWKVRILLVVAVAHVIVCRNMAYLTLTIYVAYGGEQGFSTA